MESVTVTVKLPLTLERDGRHWIACCPPLEVMTQSDTKKGAREALKEAVTLWIESCSERGVLSDALVELGFTRREPGSVPGGQVGVFVRPNPAEAKPSLNHIQVDVPAFMAARLNEFEVNASC